jgi:hypothetical protein
MSRFISSSMQAVSSLSVTAYRLLADIGVTSSTLYVCTGNQYIYALGNTYSPVGPLGGVSVVTEETDNFPRDVTLQLAAINSAYLYEPMRESMFNRPVVLRRMFLNTEDFTPVSSAETVWRGRTAEVNINFDGEGAYYELRAETVLRRNARVQYFNRETYRAVDSSDTFGDHIDRIPLYKSQWGGKETSFAGGGTNLGRNGKPLPPKLRNIYD